MTGSSWEDLAGWWVDEVERDPAYQRQVWPLLLELLEPQAGRTYLDLGCGDGRLMALVAERGGHAIGVDLSPQLLRSAAQHGPVVRAMLPDLRWVRAGSMDGAYLSLVLEHIEDEQALFAQAAAGVRRGGVLVAVLNHPAWTAPGSAPILDDDGEVLWRPGAYFSRGRSEEPAGPYLVEFQHRTMAELLNAAASVGWALERMVELGADEPASARDPLLARQRHILRLLGVRWRRG